ncbi:hypothetical protein ACXZ9C_10510 [Streptococcus agalactiae]
MAGEAAWRSSYSSSLSIRRGAASSRWHSSSVAYLARVGFGWLVVKFGLSCWSSSS